MRPSRRLYAAVTSAASKYLEPNVPTGLTGIITHPLPRPALLHKYDLTLEKLKQLPASSVYRQSTEALTKHRMSIVEQVKPPGHAEWSARVQKVIDANPTDYHAYKRADGSILVVDELEESDPETDEWQMTDQDDVKTMIARHIPPERMSQEIRDDIEKTKKESGKFKLEKTSSLEKEPRLTAEQISELEHKLSAGLIEEVLQVAEGELILIDEMIASKAWENLEEKTPPGQWEYFDRGDRV